MPHYITAFRQGVPPRHIIQQFIISLKCGIVNNLCRYPPQFLLNCGGLFHSCAGDVHPELIFDGEHIIVHAVLDVIFRAVLHDQHAVCHAAFLYRGVGFVVQPGARDWYHSAVYFNAFHPGCRNYVAQHECQRRAEYRQYRAAYNYGCFESCFVHIITPFRRLPLCGSSPGDDPARYALRRRSGTRRVYFPSIRICAHVSRLNPGVIIWLLGISE